MQAPKQPGEQTKHQGPHGKCWNMANRATISAPDSSFNAKLCKSEICQRADAQPEHTNDQDGSQQKRSGDLPAACVGDQQPEVSGGHQRGVGHEVQQPESDDTGAACGCLRLRYSHFTVTVAASLVDMYCG